MLLFFLSVYFYEFPICYLSLLFWYKPIIPLICYSEIQKECFFFTWQQNLTWTDGSLFIVHPPKKNTLHFCCRNVMCLITRYTSSVYIEIKVLSFFSVVEIIECLSFMMLYCELYWWFINVKSNLLNILFLISCWIWFPDISLRIFTSMFMRD